VSSGGVKEAEVMNGFISSTGSMQHITFILRVQSLLMERAMTWGSYLIGLEQSIASRESGGGGFGLKEVETIGVIICGEDQILLAQESEKGLSITDHQGFTIRKELIRKPGGSRIGVHDTKTELSADRGDDAGISNIPWRGEICIGEDMAFEGADVVFMAVISGPVARGGDDIGDAFYTDTTLDPKHVKIIPITRVMEDHLCGQPIENELDDFGSFELNIRSIHIHQLHIEVRDEIPAIHGGE
jgi:hypothetical protein